MSSSKKSRRHLLQGGIALGSALLGGEVLFTQPAHADDSARSAAVGFTNDTSHRLTLVRAHLDHRSWRFTPPSTMDGDYAFNLYGWTSVSSGILTGTEGEAYYNIEGLGIQLKVHWDVPYEGSNSYDQSFSGSLPLVGDAQFVLTNDGGLGRANDLVSFTLTEIQPSGVTATVTPLGLEVYVRDGGNNLERLVYDLSRGSWQIYQLLGGTSMSTAPSAAFFSGDNLTHCFYRGPSDELRHRQVQSTEGGGAILDENLGGVITAAPGAATVSSTRLEVYVRDGGNVLERKVYDASNGGWQVYQPLGGTPMTSAPSATYFSGSGLVHCFYRGPSSELRHRQVQPIFGGSAILDENLGGSISAAPAVVAVSSSRLEVYVRDGGNVLERKVYDAALGGWQPYQSLGGTPMTSAPSVCYFPPDGVVHCFYRGPSNELRHRQVQVTPGGGAILDENLGGVIN